MSTCYHRAIQFLLQLFQVTSSQFYGVQDQEMSNVADPLLACDADVVGPGATLNNNNMDIDMDVDNAGEITHSPRRSVSPQLPTSVLSGLLSMIEYASKPILIDIAKHHNVLLPLRTKHETLRDLVVSHLSSGECAESEAESCIQLVFTFHNQSDVHSITVVEPHLYNLMHPVFEVIYSSCHVEGSGPCRPRSALLRYKNNESQ